MSYILLSAFYYVDIIEGAQIKQNAEHFAQIATTFNTVTKTEIPCRFSHRKNGGYQENTLKNETKKHICTLPEGETSISIFPAEGCPAS